MDINQIVKDAVVDGKKVTFMYFKEGELWYHTETGFQFPVPVCDVGNATMLPCDKALLFMRYIRKHLEMIVNAKDDASTGASE